MHTKNIYTRDYGKKGSYTSVLPCLFFLYIACAKKIQMCTFYKGLTVTVLQKRLKVNLLQFFIFLNFFNTVLKQSKSGNNSFSLCTLIFITLEYYIQNCDAKIGSLITSIDIFAGFGNKMFFLFDNIINIAYLSPKNVCNFPQKQSVYYGYECVNNN